MASAFDTPFIQLAAGEVYSGESAVAREVQVLSGCLWLTVAGDAQDYWLQAGDALQIPPGCLVVVEAYRTPCLFSVRAGMACIGSMPRAVGAGLRAAGRA